MCYLLQYKMNEQNFKYDVAFSFTQQDEELAYNIFKLLKERLNCFISSEEQKKLAGGDGEVLFNTVFSKETRIVVILHRDEYGNTKWTRIEETAIRNRGFDEGYDFVILIPLDKPVVPPKWLPKNRLWIGLDRWGIESAASVIEARVQEFGGAVKVESVADMVARTEKEIKEKRSREQLLESEEGLKVALDEVEKIKQFLKIHFEEIRNKTPDWHIRLRENKQRGINLISYGYFLTFHFHQQYANTLMDSFLYFALYDGYFDENGYAVDPFTENKLLVSDKLRFDIDELDQKGWSLHKTRTKFMTSQKLVDKWFSEFISQSTKGRMKRQ
jgi:hypothetical protein